MANSFSISSSSSFRNSMLFLFESWIFCIFRTICSNSLTWSLKLRSLSPSSGFPDLIRPRLFFKALIFSSRVNIFSVIPWISSFTFASCSVLNSSSNAPDMSLIICASPFPSALPTSNPAHKASKGPAADFTDFPKIFVATAEAFAPMV